jgi:pimeloyl-ACP methyl ester carboxylesterase
MGIHKTWQSWLWLITSRGALLYLAFVLLIALLQRYLIYFPSRAQEENLLRQAKILGMHPWRNHSNLLIGWRSSLPNSSPQPHSRLVVFHGNAGYALHRMYYVDGFHGIPQGMSEWEVFLFEYPGYGSRAGSRNEANLAAAASQALSELLRENARPIYLLGESLGSGFASRLAAENPKLVSGIFLVTPFTRLADVAQSHYPFLPVRWILRERHDVEAYLKMFPGPVAFLTAGRDEVMKHHLGEKLYRQYAGRKKLWTQPDARHNTLEFTVGLPWWQEVTEFLKHPEFKP